MYALGRGAACSLLMPRDSAKLHHHVDIDGQDVLIAMCNALSLAVCTRHTSRDIKKHS